MNTIIKEKTTLTLEERITELAALEKVSEQEVRHHSDGSELIPAEVQVRMRRNDRQAPLVSGYTVDDEGLLNSYAIEPATYFAEYPTPKQQRRYIFQGAIATLLVTLTVLTAFSVS
jgi:hypothetical protein